MTRIIAIDRGNDAAKGALFDDGKIVRRWRGEGKAEEIASWIAEAGPEGASVSSVVPDWKIICEEAFGAAGMERYVIASFTSDWPFAINSGSLETAGTDRLCAAAGVADAGIADAVIVDAGSAVTVDILRNGVFEGGSIMPGLDMMLRSLGENTAALPRLTPGANLPGPPGTDTESAIRAGTAGALAGGVIRLVSLSAEAFGDPPPVFLTGGDAGLLVDEILPPPRHCPDLVLQGLNCLYHRKFG
jgi:type III pantothenate kinase